MDWIVPNWPAPENIHALFTTRAAGSDEGSRGAYAGLNLADHVQDDPQAVQRNRNILRQHLPADPCWLTQVHGSRAVWLGSDQTSWDADASMSRNPKQVCAILVADCLPILLCDISGSVIGAAHAGWRGLAAGIIENTVLEMREYSPNQEIIAWLGPAIGPQYFEVGEEVRAVFLEHDAAAQSAFLPGKNKRKWYANLFDLARQRLACIGVKRVYSEDLCTFSDPERFYSYRRDGQTGRMAALLWMT